MILSDNQIARLAKLGMITPFEPKLIGKAEKVLSWGPSSYGYDIRLSSLFKQVKDPDDVLDPKAMNESHYRSFSSTKPLIIEPGTGMLGASIESFNLPRDITVIATNKSSYARCFVDFAMSTVGEAGWKGVLTIEITNRGANPVKIYPGEGCLQLLFLKGMDPCDLSYADRAGKYMDQQGVQIPKV